MSTTQPTPEVMWRPSDELVATARMTAFARHVSERRGVRLESFRDLWAWSVDDLSGFWEEIVAFFDVIGDGLTGPALVEERMPGAVWYPDARVSFAENLLRHARDPQRADEEAVVEVGEDDSLTSITWRELEARVAGVADALREWGIRPGDRVAAVLPNVTEAVVALLASASVGAVWTVSSPDLTPTATLARLQQLEPRVLITADGYRYNGRTIRLDDHRAQLQAGLPSLERVAIVRILDRTAEPGGDAVAFDGLERRDAEPRYERVAFGHPLWVLFSSGTTGAPKGIVHGHGGMLIEALKTMGLHQNLGPGDRYFVAASTSWMVWNMLINSLSVGASVVVSSGSPTFGRPDRLFGVIAATKTTFFGTGAGYLSLVERAGLQPGRDHDLSNLHTILSTASPLPTSTWRWVHEAVARDVHLGSDSGGTDICSGFIGSNPLEPVHLGELQGPLLGVAAAAFDAEGNRVVGEVGELVITRPMPSMPLYLWGDESGERYRSTYFGEGAGEWRHGDWVTETERGGFVVHGRSDATLNRSGIRLGTAEIYAAVQDMPGIEQSLVIGAEQPDGGYYMPMFVVVRDGGELTDDLRDEIIARIRKHASPRHVPDEIIAVPAIPVTHSGKRVEVSVKRLYAGFPPEKAVQRDALANPEAIEWFIEDSRRFERA